MLPLTTTVNVIFYICLANHISFKMISNVQLIFYVSVLQGFGQETDCKISVFFEIVQNVCFHI